MHLIFHEHGHHPLESLLGEHFVRGMSKHTSHKKRRGQLNNDAQPQENRPQENPELAQFRDLLVQKLLEQPLKFARGRFCSFLVCKLFTSPAVQTEDKDKLAQALTTDEAIFELRQSDSTGIPVLTACGLHWQDAFYNGRAVLDVGSLARVQIAAINMDDFEDHDSGSMTKQWLSQRKNQLEKLRKAWGFQ